MSETLSLDEIYNKINVEIIEQNIDENNDQSHSLSPETMNKLNELYDKINVTIIDPNSILDEIYNKINVIIVNDVNNGNTALSPDTIEQLNELYNNINVTIDKVGYVEETEEIEEVGDVDEENKTDEIFNEILKDNFKSKLVKYMYLTLLANDIFIEINHNKLEDMNTLSKIREIEMVNKDDLIKNENEKLYNYIKHYTQVAIDRIVQ